jgi:hypothetical protein
MATITLKSIPEDLVKFILKKQFDMKVDRGINQLSLEKAIYKIIREQKELEEKNKK